MSGENRDFGASARRLIRRCGHAALATDFEGRPYVSLVAVACDLDASPQLLLSDLAQHTRNLTAEPHMSLLFSDPEVGPDPLSQPRLTLLGRAERAERADGPRLRSRFAARHPESAGYSEFSDFHLYRIVIERGHLVAGFGRIAWVAAAELRYSADCSALAAAQAEITAHMNEQHAEALALYAANLLGRSGNGWRMTGIDPEGIDLRSGGENARLDFPVPVLTPDAARNALVALAEKARETTPSG